MNMKRVISIGVAILGLVMVVYAISSMSRISDAKGNVSSINRAMSGSSAGKMAGSQLTSMAGQYDTKVRVLLIAGIVVTALGCGGVFYYRKHHR